jgi:hypothetical protein
MPVLLAVLLAAWHAVFHLHDPRLTESSALVDLGSAMVTANDSGNAPLLFVVDARTGRTIRTVQYASSQTDTEALAPAGPHAVWVGDIGDNLAARHQVQVIHMPLDGGPGTTYQLSYPDGPHDAESLFVARGQLCIVSKEFAGGAFYLAPRHLRTDRVNRLRKVAPALPIATDAATFRDGRHVLVRGYGEADVYDVPSFRRAGSFELPDERQGESVSIGPGGRIRIGSEGTHSAVLQVSLPPELAAKLAPVRPGSRPSTGQDDERPPWLPWLGGAGLVVVLAGGAAWWRRRTLRS